MGSGENYLRCIRKNIYLRKYRRGEIQPLIHVKEKEDEELGSQGREEADCEG